MTLSNIIKGIAALLVLGVIVATVWFVLRVKGEIATPELESRKVLEVLEETDLPDVEPGDRARQKAYELIAMGQLEDAKEKLHFIINFSPGSVAAKEARRILGEIHLDELFGKKGEQWRKRYEVQKGDAPLALAKKFETTLDCLMAVNGLYRLEIHPGDKLDFLPLNFNLRIDTERQALTLRRRISDKPRREEFVKEYEILRYRLPGQKAGLLQRAVRDKSGIDGSRVVSTTNAAYRGSEKVIWLKKEGWQIRSMPSEGDELPEGNGFFLARSDVEELALLLRVGNPVEIMINKD